MSTTTQLKAVKQATVEFIDSNKTVCWTDADGYLLDLAEVALSGCGCGYCGACVVELLKGEIVYEKEIFVELSAKEILLCRAKPASPHITIKL